MTCQRGVQLFVLALALGLAAPARAGGPLVGVRGGIYTDADAGFLGFRSRRPIPYLQLKLIASGNTEAVLAFGVRF